MERHSTPDQYSATIKQLRKMRDAGLISRRFVGFFIWYFWQRRHGRA